MRSVVAVATFRSWRGSPVRHCIGPGRKGGPWTPPQRVSTTNPRHRGVLRIHTAATRAGVRLASASRSPVSTMAIVLPRANPGSRLHAEGRPLADARAMYFRLTRAREFALCQGWFGNTPQSGDPSATPAARDTNRRRPTRSAWPGAEAVVWEDSPPATPVRERGRPRA